MPSRASIEALFQAPSLFELTVEALDVRLTEDRARAKRNRTRRPPAAKPKRCACGAPLPQKQMGRPRQHCTRPCREKAWRAK